MRVTGEVRSHERLQTNLSVYLNVVQIQGLGHDGKCDRSPVAAALQVGNEPSSRLPAIIAAKAAELAIDERTGSDAFIFGRDGRERCLGQLVIHALVSQLLSEHGTGRTTGSVTGCDPRPGESRIVDEPDLLEAIEDPADHLDLKPALDEVIGKLGPRPCRQREPAQDNRPSLALWVVMRTQATILVG